jgi:hypothetical protein
MRLERKAEKIGRSTLGFYRPGYRTRAGKLAYASVYWTRHPFTNKRVSTGCRTVEAAQAWKLALFGVEAVDRPGVYAVEAGGFLKVGKTTNSIRRRMRAIQTSQAHHCKLVAIVSFRPQDERAAHEALAKFHVRGEWYQLNPETLAIVAGLIERFAR